VEEELTAVAVETELLAQAAKVLASVVATAETAAAELGVVQEAAGSTVTAKATLRGTHLPIAMQTAVPKAASAAVAATIAPTTAPAAAADTQAAALPTGQAMLVAVGLITAETISQTHQALTAATVQYKLQSFNQ
jgi:hypothetical protein